MGDLECDDEASGPRPPQRTGCVGLNLKDGLEFFEEVAGRAGDIDSAGDAALTILDPLDDASGFGAFGAVGAPAGVHDLFTVAGLGNLRHGA